MANKDIFYQYKILEAPIELHLKLSDDKLKFLGNVLNIYEKEEIENFKLKITAKVSDPQSVLFEKDKDIWEYLDLILFVKGVKSIFRKCYIFEKEGNIFKIELDFHKDDWRSDVEISAILVLKKDLKEKIGFASVKGTQLGWSSSYKVCFDEPEEKSGGESMEIEWESFSGNKLRWLNKNYSKDIYALDLRGGNKMPKIYLNSDMDSHLKSILNENSKRSSLKTSSRDLMFKNISTSIFAQLLTDSLIEYNKNLQEQDQSEKSVAVENAWEELKSWKRQLIENYSHKILPDSRKKDSLDDLKESMYDDPDKISTILKIILNIAQNSLGESTQKVFSENARLHLRKEKK